MHHNIVLKRIYFLTIIHVLCLSLIGCKKPTSPQQQLTQQNANATEKQLVAQPESIGELDNQTSPSAPIEDIQHTTNQPKYNEQSDDGAINVAVRDDQANTEDTSNRITKNQEESKRRKNKKKTLDQHPKYTNDAYPPPQQLTQQNAHANPTAQQAVSTSNVENQKRPSTSIKGVKNTKRQIKHNEQSDDKEESKRRKNKKKKKKLSILKQYPKYADDTFPLPQQLTQQNAHTHATAQPTAQQTVSTSDVENKKRPSTFIQGVKKGHVVYVQIKKQLHPVVARLKGVKNTQSHKHDDKDTNTENTDSTIRQDQEERVQEKECSLLEQHPQDADNISFRPSAPPLYPDPPPSYEDTFYEHSA